MGRFAVFLVSASLLLVSCSRKTGDIEVGAYLSLSGSDSAFGIETREGISGDPNFPPVMQVEDIAVQRVAAAPHLLAARAGLGAPPEAPEEDLSGIEKVRRFPKGLKPVPA